MSAAEIAESDARLEQITQVEEDMEKMVGSGGPIDPGVGVKLVSLYEKERLESYLGQAYTRTALLHSMVGDEEQAVRYAKLAQEAMVREQGENSGDAVAMKALAENPRGHWSFGVKRPRQEEVRTPEEEIGWKLPEVEVMKAQKDL